MKFPHTHITPPKKHQLSILLTATLLGILIIIQSRSFQGFSDVLSRNSRTDIFHELQILKQTNDNLRSEVGSLEEQIDRLSNNQETLDAIRSEVEKYELLTGRTNVSGPGVRMELRGNVRAIWLTDIVNELFSAGAEAVSVNSVRLTEKTSGFDTIPSGQIVLNGAPLQAPYVFSAIGDRQVLKAALQQPQGILERLSASERGIETVLEEKDLVTMERVL